MGMKNFLKFSIHRIFAHENGLFGRQTSGKKKLLSNILRKYIFVCSIIFDKNLTVYSKVLVVHTTQHLGAFSPSPGGFSLELEIVSGAGGRITGNRPAAAAAAW